MEPPTRQKTRVASFGCSEFIDSIVRRGDFGFTFTETLDSISDLVKLSDVDLVLVDVDSPDDSRLAHLRNAVRRMSNLRVILLGSAENLDSIGSWLNLGAHGYLHKDVAPDIMVDVMHAARKRITSRSRSIHLPIRRVAPQELQARNPLSKRETEILARVANARSNRQIARELNITEGTVKRHMRNIFVKIGATSRIDSINKAIEIGAISR
ncbi:LuxR C-terminal-related transcriptional regulator [Nocardiopsis halotolerans]|uniref:LuxR C-terminal-related transcriptional regulator n=1 Tax=Nocardiopsis halotolerans TaxID=124252 RepID=UPI0019D411EE